MYMVTKWCYSRSQVQGWYEFLEKKNVPAALVFDGGRPKPFVVCASGEDVEGHTDPLEGEIIESCHGFTEGS